MLQFNSKMSNLGSKIRSLIVKKLAIKAAALTVDTIVETTAMMINNGYTDVSKCDDLSWIVVVYEKEEPKD